MPSRFLVTLAALLLWAGLAVAKVNVNNASLEELDALPGIGPARAQAIVDYREQNGPFRSGRDLKKVQGLPAGVVDKLRGELSYSTASPKPASEPKRPAEKKPFVAVRAAPEQPATAETRPQPAAPARPAMPGKSVREGSPQKATANAETAPVVVPAANRPPAPARPAMPAKPVREAPPEKAAVGAETAPVQTPTTSHPPAPARPAMPGKLSVEPHTPAAPAAPAVKPAAAPAKPAAPALPRPAMPAASN